MIAAHPLWDRIEETLVGVLGLLALLVGLLQVIGRYFDPARAISYAEEVIVYLIIWAIMIVSSQLVRTRRPCPARSRAAPAAAAARCACVEIFNCVVAIVFCGALVWYGWQIVETSLLIDETSSTDLQFPMWIYYLGAAGRRRADAGALHHAPDALTLFISIRRP